MIDFLESNVKDNPGKTTLKFLIKDFEDKLKINLYTLEKSFTMNDDMALYLNNRNDIGVSVLTAQQIFLKIIYPIAVDMSIKQIKNTGYTFVINL